MHTNKGYIVPVILVIILLSVAGVFIFSQKPTETPVIVETNSFTVPTVYPKTNDQTATTTSKDIEEDEDDMTATTTASTTVDVSIDS